MEGILTLQKLKEMTPSTIFASGDIKDPRIHRDIEITWIACRGGIHDWCIYYHKKGTELSFIQRHGDKCFTKEVIRELVPCDDEAFKMYRH